jgi:glycosyltransferase involved in cell wall biosynthesis
MTPTVYILMPVYNCETLLPNALASVNKQIYKNIKCIIYNDGSTDLSRSIIEEHIEQNPGRCTLINSLTRSGIANARYELQNHIIKNSRPEDLVMNLDADDKLTTQDFASSFVDRMIETNADICLWGFDVVYEDESLKANSFLTIKELKFSKDIINFICNSPNNACSPEEIPDLHLFTSLGATKGYRAPLFKTLPRSKMAIDAKFTDFVCMAGLFGAKKITALPWEQHRYEYLKRSSSITGERKPKDLICVVEQLGIFWEHSLKNSTCREFIKLKINDYEKLATMLVETHKFTKEDLRTYKEAAEQLLAEIS